MGPHRRPPKSERRSFSSERVGRDNVTSKKNLQARQLKPLLEAHPEWHSISLKEIAVTGDLFTPSQSLIQSLHDHARNVLETEIGSYGQSSQQSSSAHKFYTTIMNTGTWSDRISALTLLIQESPVHNTKALDSLMNMASKKNRQQALMALSALKDMFAQGTMLPVDRKLRLFAKQPGLWASLQGRKSTWTPKEDLPESLTKEHLLLWAFEDYLKGKYFELLRLLEAWCNDEVEYAKMRSLTFVWELLKDRPEQEENLLRLLVNKLGDTDKKVASRASYLLLQTQVLHPSMKPIIIDGIESEVLLRPGQSAHAKYYAIITLNQTILSSANPEVANKLLNIYFSLFVTMLNTSKDEHRQGRDERAEGLNDNEIERPMKRKRSDTSVGGSGKAEQELEERITAQVLTGVNRAFPFSNSESGSFEKHIDTMFRITHSSNFNTSIQALMLIQHISTSQHVSLDRYMRTLYESLLDPRLLKSSKQTMYLNLLYRSLKTDSSIRRVRAFVKRLLQISSLHDPSFGCAVLFMILELQNSFPSLKSFLSQPELQDEDEEEHFDDVISDDEGQHSDAPAHQSHINGNAMPGISRDKTNIVYSGRKRDPEHSNADRSCLWELCPWSTHYHPSVTVFAKSLLESTSASAKAPPKPDPQSHTLMNFLDRFVYRNARTKHLSADAVPVRGTSIMQPALGATNAVDTLYSRDRSTLQAQPLNREAFWSRRAEEVAPDEVFFHQYFGQVSAHKKSIKAPSNNGASQHHEGSDAEWDDDVGAGEDEIWRALVGSRKELGDDNDVDMDDASDFDDEDVDIAEDMVSESDDASDGSENVPSFGDEGVQLNLDSDDSDGLDDEVDEHSDLVDGTHVLEVPSEGLKSMDDFAKFDSGEDDDEEDDDIPVHLGSDDDADVLPAKKRSKQARNEPANQESSREKKRRLKALPTFASAEDYAQLIDEHDAPDGGDDWKTS